MEDIKREFTERTFERWRDRLTTADATPLIMVGIQHGEREGEPMVCAVGVSDSAQGTITLKMSDVCRYLRRALEDLERGDYKVHRPI